MTNRLLALVLFGGMLAAGMQLAPRAEAMPLRDVISTIQNSGGRYVAAGATLRGSDCSGLVSVAQTLATGAPVRRLGSTRTLLAGQWPGVIPGASAGDRFIIAANRSHMVASIDGVGIEATTSGQPYKIGPAASSVWDPKYSVRVHIDSALLV